MSISERFFEHRAARWFAPILLAGTLFGAAESPAIAGPPPGPTLSPDARGCMPTERLPPLPIIRSDNTPKQFIRNIGKIDRIEIFDPVERRVITTLVGRMRAEFLIPIEWNAKTHALDWVAQLQRIGRPLPTRPVFLFYPKDDSLPFLGHLLSDTVLRLQRERPYERGDTSSGLRDSKLDLLTSEHHSWWLVDALTYVRPLEDFCPTRIRMPDCELEQARRAHEPVVPPRVRADNTASKLVAARHRITRVKIWSQWHRGIVGELDESEVGAWIEQLGATTSPVNEWAANPWPWAAALLVDTDDGQLPFAVHVISDSSLRVSPADPMSPMIGPGSRDLTVQHDLIRILSRYLGPEDPFSHMQFERQRELQRRCHPHSEIGADPWPDLPRARVEPVD